MGKRRRETAEWVQNGAWAVNSKRHFKEVPRGDPCASRRGQGDEAMADPAMA